MLLIFNAGSSSLRFTLFEEKNGTKDDLKQLYRGHIDALGLKTCHFRRYLGRGEEKQNPLKIKTHAEATKYALERLISDGAILAAADIKTIGHRVVHGGASYRTATQINAKVIKDIEALSPLAPLHNPANLAVIKSAQKLFPKAKNYAVFDTAFYADLPQKAFLYGLPYALYTKDKIRRYGFQGTSHSFVAGQAARLLKKPLKSLALITCHIGNGISITAIKNGKAVDTTMGFTPLEGPMMGTRSGTVDPGIVLHLMKKFARANAVEKVENLLQKESGFLGLSGIGSDIRALHARPKSEGTLRTFDVFSYQMAKLILSFLAPLGRLPDAIIFTAGIGENAPYLRKQICAYLNPFMAKVKILVIHTDEELEIARQIAKR
ncbi:MAG: acetate/propionate family kinase [Candidatus Gracilibacteria bacterium]|jgi:acetate kinase